MYYNRIATTHVGRVDLWSAEITWSPTMIGDATLTVAGRVVEPCVMAIVLTMVAPAGMLSTVEEGGIFWVAAAAAARAAMPLI